MLYPGLSISALALHRPRLDWDQAWAAPDGTRPSLLLDFVQQIYSIAGVQVANPLSGARVGRPAVDVTTPGLVVEPTRTNLVLSSVASTSNWTANGATLANMSLGALGLFPGLSVASTGATWNRANSSVVTYIADTDYTATFWYRAGTSGKARLNLFATSPATNIEVGGNVGALAILAVTNATVSEVINTDLGEGAWRVQVTFRMSNALTLSWGIGPMTATTGQTVIALGVQVEQGVMATGYIATTGSALTRAADVRGLGSAGWAGVDAGSLVVTARAEGARDTPFAQLANAANDTLTLFRAISGEICVRRGDSGGTVVTGSGVTVARGMDARMALGWDAAGLALSVNGAAVVMTAAPDMRTPASLSFNAIGLGETYGPSLTAILRHYPKRLSDTALAAITA